MTLFDLAEVAKKGTIKKIEFEGTLYWLEDFVFVNVACGGALIGPEEYTIKSIYLLKNESGLCAEVDLILDESKNIIKKALIDFKED